MDLLAIRWVRRLLVSPWFPLIPQVILLGVFAILVAGGLGVDTSDMAFAKVLRNTNLANLIVWAYWWPAMLLAALLLGRAWCMVCPMELVTSVASRIGLRRDVPELLKSKWAITLLYAVILVFGMYAGAIHRVPHRMAIYMLALLGLAALTGLIFSKRAFCSYLCPIGHLLGLYSCMAIPFWRAKSPTACDNCKRKDCIDPKRAHRLIGRSCASDLFPRDITDSRDCLMCTQCLKVCPTENLQLSLRKPFSGLFPRIDLRHAEVGFILLVVGFLWYDIVPEVPQGKAALMWLPEVLVQALTTTGTTSDILTGTVLFIGYPAALLGAVLIPARILSETPLGELAKAFGLLLLPTVACAHVVKGIFKAVSRLPYFPYVFSDPRGVETARGFIDKSLTLDPSAPNLLAPPVNYGGVAVLLIALVVTFWIYRKSATLEKLAHRAKLPLLLGTLAVWGILALTIVLWRF